MSLLERFTVSPAFIWQMPGVFVLKDKNSNYLAANKLATNLMGYSSIEQVIGITDYDWKCEAVNFADQFVDEDKKVIENDKPLSILYILKYNEGKICPLYATKSPLKDPNSRETIGIIFQATVITNKLVNELTKEFLTYHKYSTQKASKLGCFYIDEQKEIDSPLTNQESLCLFYLLRGKTAREIGQILNRSHRTIEIHIDHIKKKFSCSKKSELIEKAISLGFLNYLPKKLLFNDQK